MMQNGWARGDVGSSPGGSGAEEQLPKKLPEEPSRQPVLAGALAEAAEVLGQLLQQQRLGLRQGRGGQQGSGSLATLLQARGLCQRGEKSG